MTKTRMEAALEDAVANFTDSLVTTIRQATIEELAGLAPDPPPTRKTTLSPRPVPVVALAPVEAPEPAVEDHEVVGETQRQDKTPVSTTEAPAAPAKAKPKRAWPTCSVEGCDAKMYGPSGPAKRCYQHHIAGGGKPSPFARKRKTGSSPAEGPAEDALAKPKVRKVIRRRKGEQRADAASAPIPPLEAVDNPPLSSKDQGLRRVESQLSRKT